MSDLVGNPDDRFSGGAAHFVSKLQILAVHFSPSNLVKGKTVWRVQLPPLSPQINV